jgi:hypothetical protein
MQKPSYPVAVVMRRRPALSRWAEFVWEPWSVLTGYTGSPEARVLVEEEGVVQWLHPGFRLELHRDEAEGYYMNVSSASPKVFVLWRMEEEQALPLEVTVSYDEAGRWLDGGHFVDSVPMPAEIFAWAGKYVEDNYRPEPKKRIKPRSFQHPKDRIS